MTTPYPFTITGSAATTTYYIDKNFGGSGLVYSYIGLQSFNINFTTEIPDTGSNDRFSNNQPYTKFFLKTTLFGDGTNPVYINLMDMGSKPVLRIATILTDKGYLYNGTGPVTNTTETCYLFRTLPTFGANITVTFEIVRCNAATNPTTFNYVADMTFNTIHNNQETVGNLGLFSDTLFRAIDIGIQVFPIRLTASGNLTAFNPNFTAYFNARPLATTMSLTYTMVAGAVNNISNTTYSAGSFTEPSANTIVFTFSSPSDGINCLAHGTQVLTPSGYKFVQDIKEGNLLTTYDGRTTTVNNVCSRTIISNNELYLIKKDGFGLNTPSEDLYLSNWHAVFYNGVFHHPCHWNNENVIKVDQPAIVKFYHFEVDNYFTDFIIANNMVVETNNINPKFSEICSYECTPSKCSIRMSGEDILLTNEMNLINLS
jgi:hypothetical protein